MRMKTKFGTLAAALLMAGGAVYAVAQTRPVTAVQPAAQNLTQGDQSFLLSLLTPHSSRSKTQILSELDQKWTPAYVAPSLEIFNFTPDPEIRDALVKHLTKTTGQNFGTDTNAWYRWLWNQPEIKTTGYDNFKAEFYRAIDPKFEKYFKNRGDSAKIRLDEIRWGGVLQDGIPPLRQPKMINANQANYLEDDNVVFGIEVNGDVRAYPKRILAWHEMFVDKVGGVDVAGVYCTLCGTVILYETELDGTAYNVGTSGFLYRSNKLMYDKATQSLWNTIKGEPVLGPLAGKGIALQNQSVVTTTWGEWKRRHPKTKVLSLDTGYKRDYGEGVAYHEYFATDRLMFTTPYNDQRLKNKDEVLALRFKSSPREQLAISADFLKKTPVYTDKLGTQNIVVLTDKTGANRVYDPKGVSFKTFDGDMTARDSSGKAWTVTESKLVSADGQELKRLPYNRAFWFGWHATYPDSRLVK
ncbi:DUF3179 domain-containing protein [Hellea sp.]|nr:DUF3179 domain-containing protein [Hellea sp.]